MIASSSSLLAASSLLLLTTAQQPSPSSPPADPYSKFILDANALLASATGPAAPQLAAIYTWQATETAVPSDALDSQYQDYLNAYVTTTSAPLPAFVTAIPAALQPVVTSFLRAEANLVAQDLAPIVSQDKAAWSAAQATTSLNNTTISTPAPRATASSGAAVNSANATGTVTMAISANGTATAPITTTFTTATGSATKSVTPPPKPQTTSGAEKKPAGVALVAAIVGIAGMMVLL